MHQCCGGLDCNRAFDQCAAPAPPGSTLFNTALAVAPADVRAGRGARSASSACARSPHSRVGARRPGPGGEIPNGPGRGRRRRAGDGDDRRARLARRPGADVRAARGTCAVVRAAGARRSRAGRRDSRPAQGSAESGAPAMVTIAGPDAPDAGRRPVARRRAAGRTGDRAGEIAIQLPAAGAAARRRW